MTQELCIKLLKRHDKAMSEAEQWRDLLDTVYFYAMPNRNPYDGSSKGTELNARLYDGTLALATRKFVNRMIKALTPPEIDWIKLVPGVEVPEGEKEAQQELLQKATDTFFFYLRRSNFDLTIQEAFYDMTISMGLLQLNEGSDDDLLKFSSIPSDQVGVEVDPQGELSGYFRTWREMPLDQAQYQWDDQLKIPQAILDQQEPKLHVKECSYFDFKEKTYKYYVLESTSKEIMFEQDLGESWPWIGFRWNRRSGESRGRGPAMDAFPTAATINKAVEDELVSAALRANPPYMAFHDFVINPYNFRVEPNTLIPVNPMGTETWPIAPLPNGGDISFTALVVNDLRAQINEIMMAQPLQPLQDGPVRTATEVAVTQNELRENAGASFSRVQRELFDPLVKRVLYILQRNGKIPKFVVDGKEVAISYATPLSVSKDVNDVTRFVEWYQIIAGLFTPGIAINMVEAAQIPKWTAEKLNTNLSLVKSSAEVQKLIDQALEAAQDAVESQQPGPQEEFIEPSPPFGAV